MNNKILTTIISNDGKQVEKNLPTYSTTKALRRTIDLSEKNIVKYIHFYPSHISSHKTYSISDYNLWQNILKQP